MVEIYIPQKSTNAVHREFFFRDQSVHVLLLDSTLLHGALKSVLHLCLCLSCRSGAEAEGWRSPL